MSVMGDGGHSAAVGRGGKGRGEEGEESAPCHLCRRSGPVCEKVGEWRRESERALSQDVIGQKGG